MLMCMPSDVCSLTPPRSECFDGIAVEALERRRAILNHRDLDKPISVIRGDSDDPG
jgi:hypothetical protein